MLRDIFFGTNEEEKKYTSLKQLSDNKNDLANFTALGVKEYRVGDLGYYLDGHFLGSPSYGFKLLQTVPNPNWIQKQLTSVGFKMNIPDKVIVSDVIDNIQIASQLQPGAKEFMLVSAHEKSHDYQFNDDGTVEIKETPDVPAKVETVYGITNKTSTVTTKASDIFSIMTVNGDEIAPEPGKDTYIITKSQNNVQGQLVR